MHCALSSLVLPFMGKEGIPIACNNWCICQGLLIAESCLLAWYPSSFYEQRVKAFLPLPAWPDLKALQQNLNRHRSVQVCLDQYNRILRESEIWTFAETICFVIWGLKGLWWLIMLLFEHQLSKRPWNGECGNCLLHLSENDRSLQKSLSPEALNHSFIINGCHFFQRN